MKLIYIVERVIEFSFYALFFVTPFLFNPSRTLPSFELFEWNKLMFVYAMTSVITTAWVIRMILYRKFLFSKTFLDIPLLLFLTSQILATIFSIDPHVSLFGYYSRFHGGLLSTISYALLYWTFVSNRELIKWKRLLEVMLVAGAGVATYGILEKFGIDAQMWVQDVQNRVFSTLGQPNWLAAYLDILLLLILSFAVQVAPISWRNLKRMSEATKGITFLHAFPKLRLTSSPFSVLIYLLLTIVSVFSLPSLLSLVLYTCLLFTKSRSGFLGFWAGNVFFWSTLFLIQRFSWKKYLPHFMMLNLFFLILNLFIKTPFQQYNRLLTVDVFGSIPVSEETKPPVGDSVINVGITDSADIRRIVWKGAIDIARAYPLFGTGPETFAYSYYKFRPAAHNLTSEWDFLYNRAHNEYLNLAATSGFLGLGLYLGIIGTVIFWTLIQMFKANSPLIGHNHVFLVCALFAAYISILITNFFGFSVVVVGLYFFLIPAIIFSLVNVKIPVEKPNVISSRQILISGVIVIGLLTLLMLLVRFWIADSLYARGLSYSRQEEYGLAYPFLKEAINLRGDEPNFRDELSLVGSHLSLSFIEKGEATAASELIHEAVDASNFALRTSPQNVNFWKTRTKMYFALSILDQSFVQSALDSILIARELAPTDPKIAYNAAVIYGHANSNKEAIDVLVKTIDLKPDYRDAYIALSIFYEEEKQIDKAREILELASKRINPEDEEIKERIEKLNNF